MEKFPLGFWNYKHADTQGPDEVETWTHCGMTLTMSGEYDPDTCSKANMLAMLDEAHAQGMKIIICDSRSRWHGASTDPEGYRARFAQALADFGSHPAVYGFHVGDEPDDEQQADAIAAIQIQNEMAPHLVAFLNHLPFYGGAKARVGIDSSVPWPEYLADFARKSGVKLLCYDHYAQMNPEDSGVQNYFLNMRMYSEAAKACGIPWWTTLLSVGHFRYRCPSEDDIRWQLYTALASGCRGILWFFFYMCTLHNFRLSPIDEHGERTQTYASISRIQRTFLKKEGPTMAKLTADKVVHVNRAFGGYPLFVIDDDPLVSRVVTTDDLPAIVTWYTHENGSKYLSVVNNSQTDSMNIDVILRGAHRVWRIDFGPKETELIPAKWGDTTFRVNENETRTNTWLAPGQMELYRVE